MKNFIKNNLKVFVTLVISGIVFTGIGVYAASQYFARDISFTPTNENFKKENGEAITNVEDALNELYNNIDSNIQIIYQKSYLGDGITFSYKLDKNYKKIIVQGDCRAADKDIYFNIISPTSFTKEYDSGTGVVMDNSWDITIVYSALNLKKDEVIQIKGRYKGNIIIYGIE